VSDDALLAVAILAGLVGAFVVGWYLFRGSR
jgi:hypothetical protein